MYEMQTPNFHGIGDLWPDIGDGVVDVGGTVVCCEICGTIAENAQYGDVCIHCGYMLPVTMEVPPDPRNPKK